MRLKKVYFKKKNCERDISVLLHDQKEGENIVYLSRTTGLVVKNHSANAGDVRDTGSTPGLGRFSEEGNGNPLQHSCLENPMDRGVWRAKVHRIINNWPQSKQLNAAH